MNSDTLKSEEPCPFNSIGGVYIKVILQFNTRIQTL